MLKNEVHIEVVKKLTDDSISKEKRALNAIEFTIRRFNRYRPFISITIDMFIIKTDIASEKIKCSISEENISLLNTYVKEAFFDNLNELFRAFGFKTVQQTQEESDETGKGFIVFILGGFLMNTTTK